MVYLGSKINDKTLYVVKHCQVSLKGSKIGLGFKKLCHASEFDSILLEYFANNSLSTTFINSHLLTSGHSAEYKF